MHTMAPREQTELLRLRLEIAKAKAWEMPAGIAKLLKGKREFENRYGMRFQTTVATTIAKMAAPNNVGPGLSPANARQTIMVPSIVASLLDYR